MKLLFIGDVVGKRGVEFLSKKLYNVKKSNNIDITVINGENSATGNGITINSATDLFRCGADVITTGNHVFRRSEAVTLLEENPCVIRPANYPEDCPGKSFYIIDMGYCSIAVINLMGTAFLGAFANPFHTIDNILENIDTPNIFVDFHAEATSEKKALGHYLAGRVTGVFGTHTHVQTSDETILKNSTAYITDVGMTGAENSVLGIKSEIIIRNMMTLMPAKFIESEEPCFMNGVIVDFDEKNGKARKIDRLIVR